MPTTFKAVSVYASRLLLWVQTCDFRQSATYGTNRLASLPLLFSIDKRRKPV